MYNFKTLKKMNLNNLNLVELNAQEKRETEGGFLPMLVVYGCWAVMVGCCIVAAGMKSALNEHKK